jgi:hypothetical protein
MDKESAQSTLRNRRPWEPPTIQVVGKIGEVLRHGGGKLTVSFSDPGEEMRKPSGQPG